MNYKKTLQKICIIFVTVLLALTFFSQTLADLRTPQVTLAFIQPGVISPVAYTTGIVELADTQLIFAPIEGTIIQIANAGEQLSGDDVLFTIHSDLQRLQELLNQAQDEQRLIALNVERVNSDRTLEQQRINQLTAGGATGTSLIEYDLQLTANNSQLEIARRELADQENLYSQGLIPRQDVTEKENAVQTLELVREQILARRSIAEERQAGIAAEQRQARSAQLQMHQAAISQLDIQLRIHSTEAEGVQRRINDLISQLEGSGLVKIYAEHPQRILEIMPGLAVGARVGAGIPIMSSAFNNSQFVIEAPFSPSQTFVRQGSNAVIRIGEERYESQIQRVFAERGQSAAVIYVESGQLSGGELAQVRIEGTSRSFQQIIPRSALREDARGYYMLSVEAEERLFGISYYVSALRVDRVASRDDRFAAVASPDFGPIPVIVNSDVPVYPGDRVRPVDSGDLIDTR